MVYIFTRNLNRSRLRNASAHTASEGTRVCSQCLDVGRQARHAEEHALCDGEYLVRIAM